MSYKQGEAGPYDTDIVPYPPTEASSLSPQFIGREGWRVEVVTTYGEVRRFIIGKSTGRCPIHLELAQRNSSGGIGAEYTYASVRFLYDARK